MNPNRHHFSTHLALVCTLVLADAASAQQAQPAEPRTVAALDEVVVTAQKREERLLEVPIAISAITGQALADAGAVQLADFLESSPGVGIVDDQSGTQTIQIRGISSTFGNATVGYYLDELPFTYIGNSQVPDVRTYDLERIEILRGPQGTLYGDGSIGGTIRILTKDPDLTSFQAGVDLDGSSTTDGEESYAAKGMLNVPVGGTAALRLVASREDFGGWVDRTGPGAVKDQNGRDIDNVRAKFRWQPSEDLDVVLGAWLTRNDTVGTSESLPNRTTAVPADTYATDYDVYSVTVRWSAPWFDVVSATSKMDYANDFISTLGGGAFTIFEEQDLLSQELRLTSKGDGTFRWTAGVFYRDIDRRTLTNLAAFALTQDQTQESRSWAVFGEGTLSLLERRLDVTLGARYFEDDRLFSEPVDPATLAIVQQLNPNFQPRVEPKFDTFNPRLNVSYRFSDDWMVYGNIAKGFRTGQAQPVISLVLATLRGVTLPSAIDPEELWSYEIGSKASFMDGRAVFEGAVFYNDWKDIQTLVTLRTGPRVAGLVNGGTAKTTGVELGLTLQPVDGLTLQFTGAYVDAKYTQSITGTPVRDGDRIVGVPETTFAASATYRWPLTAALTGFARGALQYTGDRTDVASAFKPSEDTTTADLRLGVEGGSWSAYVYGDNLTDEDAAIDPTAAGPSGIATRFRPRTFGLNVRYDLR
jgi:outer membrane receptor protein involved in Fe transport